MPVVSDDVIDWLMAGDPVIRWQTQRDLLGQPKTVWEKERWRTIETGWGAGFLAAMTPDGTWPVGRWTDTVWTLLQIMDCGLPPDYPPLQTAARSFIDRHLGEVQSNKKLLHRVDLCHLGFWLRIGSYFLGKDSRLTDLATIVLGAQLHDGGFNCRVRNYPHTRHSSFHTTFNILEALPDAAKADIITAEVFRTTEARALEFMLAHRMYRSDKTGEIVDLRFTHLSYPSHWHYTVLRGLDYVRNTPEIADSRLADAVGMIEGRRKPNGRWPVEKRIPGVEHFDMEKLGGESRWNTLRARRVLGARLAIVA